MPLLSKQTIEIIRSTVPVLEIHGTEITTRFYARLFENTPELLNVFNHSNQQEGRQQTALANAVYAAAVHIDRLNDIMPTVKQIAQKHRGIGVKPEHYPIVGENLLAAMSEVLGDAATPEILQAWSEAYGEIAGAFISVEQQMYEEVANKPGGWIGYRRFIVDKKVVESDVITSFYLRPEDGSAIVSYEPGQYLTFSIHIPGEKYAHVRHYSLSDVPNPNHYRISVKREDTIPNQPPGKVSTYLHAHVNEGDVLEVSAPAGDFILSDTDTIRPLVFLSGGVGMTPILSMLKSALHNNATRDITYIHAAINGDVHAFQEEVETLAKSHPNLTYKVVYETPTENDQVQRKFNKSGFIDLPWLQSVLSGPEADFYFCGPAPFMHAMNRCLRDFGVAEQDIHYEVFGPQLSFTA